MSRKRKRNEVEALFKESFTVSFIHKPSMETTEDTFYYIVLDDLVRLRIKLFGNIMVIDEVTPLTMKYMADVFKTLIELLTNQDKYTVLISILGNTTSIRESCLNMVLIEDDRFITVPLQYYKRMVDYYKGDISKYGFYLLSVVEDGQQADEPTKTESSRVTDLKDLDLPDEVDMGPPIIIGVKPLIDRFIDFLSETYTVEEDGLRTNAEARLLINGVHFRAKTNENESDVTITNIRFDEEYRRTDGVRLFVRICDFIDVCPDVYIEADSSESNTVCEFLSLPPQTTKLGARISHTTLALYKAKHFN